MAATGDATTGTLVMALYTKRTVHDVAFGSNLDWILRGLIGALNRFTDILGAGLKAVALALSTPQDNSPQVQQELDKVEAKLKSTTDKLQSAIDKSKGE